MSALSDGCKVDHVAQVSHIQTEEVGAIIKNIAKQENTLNSNINKIYLILFKTV